MKKFQKVLVIGAVVATIGAGAFSVSAAAVSPADILAGLTGQTSESIVQQRTDGGTYGAIAAEYDVAGCIPRRNDRKPRRDFGRACCRRYPGHKSVRTLFWQHTKRAKKRVTAPAAALVAQAMAWALAMVMVSAVAAAMARAQGLGRGAGNGRRHGPWQRYLHLRYSRVKTTT